jgi:D-arabinose 1-dehydrogenase-like Zn-dependent alcohol dehydrogenase
MDLRRVFWNQYAILGSTMGNAAEYEAIVRVLAAGALRPIVDRAYALGEVRTALERLRARDRLGKVVVLL